MNTKMSNQVRRVRTTEPIIAGQRWDYTDSFEVKVPGFPMRPPADWVRAGLSATPGPIKRIVGALGARRPGLPGGFRTIVSNDDFVHLEATLPLMRVRMVGRNTPANTRVLTTALEYRSPVWTRMVWALIAPLHRRTARALVASAVR